MKNMTNKQIHFSNNIIDINHLNTCISQLYIYKKEKLQYMSCDIYYLCQIQKILSLKTLYYIKDWIK